MGTKVTLKITLGAQGGLTQTPQAFAGDATSEAAAERRAAAHVDADLDARTTEGPQLEDGAELEEEFFQRGVELEASGPAELESAPRRGARPAVVAAVTGLAAAAAIALALGGDRAKAPRQARDRARAAAPAVAFAAAPAQVAAVQPPTESETAPRALMQPPTESETAPAVPAQPSERAHLPRTPSVPAEATAGPAGPTAPRPEARGEVDEAELDRAAPGAAPASADEARPSCALAFERKAWRLAAEACAEAFEAQRALAAPARAALALRVAQAHYARSRYDEALGWAKRAATLDPAAAEAFVLIGEGERRSGQIAAAGEAYRRYLELAPRGWHAPMVRSTLRRL